MLVNEALAAILFRTLLEPDERPDEGWFLQGGFGPCNHEGLIFPTLESSRPSRPLRSGHAPSFQHPSAERVTRPFGATLAMSQRDGPQAA